MALSDQPEIDSTPDYHRRGCSLGRWSQTLPAQDREVLRGWLADPMVTHTAIVDRINTDDDYEFRTSLHMVGRHRRRECTCGSL